MSLDTFFYTLDRSQFMTVNKELAHLDTALPIGYDQTISQPSLVFFMSKTLDVDKHHKVLELGTGSGYQTAILAEFAGHVFTIERIVELQQKAIGVLGSLGYTNITYILDDGSEGLSDHAPFDRIMVTAAVSRIPPALIEQLANDGKMIIPVGGRDVQELMLISKDHAGNVEADLLEAVRFVPLVGKYEY